MCTLGRGVGKFQILPYLVGILVSELFHVLRGTLKERTVDIVSWSSQVLLSAFLKCIFWLIPGGT